MLHLGKKPACVHDADQIVPARPGVDAASRMKTCMRMRCCSADLCIACRLSNGRIHSMKSRVLLLGICTCLGLIMQACGEVHASKSISKIDGWRMIGM